MKSLLAKEGANLHNINPIRNILELGVRPASTFIENERVQVMPETKRDIEGRKDEHQRSDDDERPVQPFLAFASSKPSVRSTAP